MCRYIPSLVENATIHSPLCYALSIDTPEIMALKAKALAPCSCFKVKVAGIPAADEERLRAVHEAMPNAKLWIDAKSVLYALECP